MTASAAIAVTGLTKRFGDKTVVDGIDITVPRGQIHGFLGPNGSGKTTTLRMLCGLLTPDGGTGTCLDLDIRRDANAIRRRIGYMTQKFSYWDDLTITENLAFVAQVYDLANAQQKVEKALERLGLTERRRQLVGQLSGGWKQRLALAASVLHDPDLLLLDEPTAGVDPKARRAFWDEIHHLAADGVTVLVSTHYMDEAERCHAIITMSAGRIMARGSVAEVIAGAGLTTWVAKGPGLMDLAAGLQQNPAVASAAPFGDSLHVSGVDARALEAAIAPYRDRADLTWRAESPSLEDVFIRYMGGTA